MRKLCLYFIVLITFGAFLLNHLAFCVVVYVLYVLKDHFSDLTNTFCIVEDKRALENLNQAEWQ